ncbi:MAG: aminoacyl-tRNA hydrolase [Pseudomonadota bacterium]
MPQQLTQQRAALTTKVSIIAGLGNPGDEYAQTRHNAGFWFVDALARKHEAEWKHQRRFDAETTRITLAGQELWLIKPMSFMNCSGGPIRAVADYFRLSLDTLLVAHDELDLPAGTVRLKTGGGHGGHNGLRDIISHCGSGFLRLRLGIGHPGSADKVLGYVLKRASAKEQTLLDEATEKAVSIVPKMIRKGPGIVMNELNRKPKKKKPPKIDSATPQADATETPDGD